MDKPFKFGFMLGRFQHLHKGHQRIIDAGLNSCESLLLIVGSSQESGTERNPYNLKTRMDAIREVYKEEISNGNLLLAHTDDYTNEGDDSYAWGDFLLNKIEMWRQHYGINHKLDCMISGKEERRVLWFREGAMDDVSQIIISKGEENATEIRNYLAKDDKWEWFKKTPFKLATDEWYTRLRKELLSVPYYKEKGLNNEQNRNVISE